MQLLDCPIDRMKLSFAPNETLSLTTCIHALVSTGCYESDDAYRVASDLLMGLDDLSRLPATA